MTVCYSNLQKSFSYVNCTSSWIEPKSKTSNKRGVKQVPTLQYIALFKLFKLRPTFFTLALESTQTTWGLLEEWSSCITAWCGKCLTFPGVLKVSTFSITPFFSRSLITIKLSLFLLTILTHLLVFHSVFINKWVGFMHNTVFLCGCQTWQILSWDRTTQSLLKFRNYSNWSHFITSPCRLINSTPINICSNQQNHFTFI